MLLYFYWDKISGGKISGSFTSFSFNGQKVIIGYFYTVVHNAGVELLLPPINKRLPPI